MHENGSVDVMDRLVVFQIIPLKFLLVHTTLFINSSYLHCPFVCLSSNCIKLQFTANSKHVTYCYESNSVKGIKKIVTYCGRELKLC